MYENRTSNFEIRTFDSETLSFSTNEGVDGFNLGVLAITQFVSSPIVPSSFLRERLVKYGFGNWVYNKPKYSALILPGFGPSGTVLYRDFFGPMWGLIELENKGVRVIPYVNEDEFEEEIRKLEGRTELVSSR